MDRDDAKPAGIDALRLKVGDDELLVLAISDEPRAGLDLTPAEAEVVALVREGLSNAGIAARRGTSVRTVANQLASVFGKLGISSRMELVARLAGGA